jgi:hypothetical protein
MRLTVWEKGTVVQEQKSNVTAEYCIKEKVKKQREYSGG